MKIYKYTQQFGKHITQYNSDFIMTRISSIESTSHFGCMHLGKNGNIGNHQAVTPQLLIIMNGEGFVKGNEGIFQEAGAGDAVFWDKGEWHETTTENGLTALVIESEGLSSDLFTHLS